MENSEQSSLVAAHFNDDAQYDNMDMDDKQVDDDEDLEDPSLGDIDRF